MNIEVPTRWLHDAWCGTVAFKVKPQLFLSNKTLKITFFRESGVGMRSIVRPVDSLDTCSIEVPNTLRCYVKKIMSFVPIIQLHLTGTTLNVMAELPSYALRYKIPDIVLAEDRFVPSSNKDICIDVCARDWLNILSTLPAKGQVTISCTAQQKMVTMKHSGNRWGAVLTARAKSPGTMAFCCSSGLTKFCFDLKVVPENVFSKLIFMECGVLQWSVGNQTVYLAPQVD